MKRVEEDPIRRKGQEAVITRAHRLPDRCSIHCLSSCCGVNGRDADFLAIYYRNTLQLAKKGLFSLAFPALPTGAFGYHPLGAAGVDITAEAGVAANAKRKGVFGVRFMLRGEEALPAFSRALEDV
ncbi:macro domain-containing protein [Desulfothermobacter acidiphilus]|uniref:macro domain-containing protein n=1 Tax=Desulfothermobacter acidiphilus TaxID=1938353 RepID=UPI003F8B3616